MIVRIRGWSPQRPKASQGSIGTSLERRGKRRRDARKRAQPHRRSALRGASGGAPDLLDQGRIFADPLAVTLLGEMAELAAEQARAHPSTTGLRLFIAARSRIAETLLASGVETRGVPASVVPGAGARHIRLPQSLQRPVGRVRSRPPGEDPGPGNVAVSPGNRHQAEPPEPLPTSRSTSSATVSWSASLVSEGFDPGRRAFFTWLGVVPYLTKDAIFSTLGLIASLPGGGEVVFDYSDPPDTLPRDQRKAHLARAAGVAARGEPFLSYFEPAQRMRSLALAWASARSTIWALRRLITGYFSPGAPTATDRQRGGHVISAATPSRGE